jgi:hypothetical protein
VLEQVDGAPDDAESVVGRVGVDHARRAPAPRVHGDEPPRAVVVAAAKALRPQDDDVAALVQSERSTFDAEPLHRRLRVDDHARRRPALDGGPRLLRCGSVPQHPHLWSLGLLGRRGAHAIAVDALEQPHEPSAVGGDAQEDVSVVDDCERRRLHRCYAREAAATSSVRSAIRASR